MGYRHSSVRTSGTFWGKSPYADGLTYGMYGTDGDYNNSLTYMFGEMTDRFGFMVFTADRDQIHYEDGFDTDYDAEVAAESWIEQNASQYITASVASRKMSYYDPGEASFFGEDIDPGDGLYGTVWFGFPEDGEHAFNIEAVEKSDGTLQCDVMSPEDYDHGNGYIGVDSVDSFTATDWGNMYDVFNQRFTFGPLRSIIDDYFSAIYDDDDHDEFASVSKGSRNSSMKKSYISEFDTWGESVDSYNEDGPFHATIAYGEPYNDDNSVTMEAVGDNGVDGPVNCKVLDISWDNVIDTFQAETWDEAVREFEYRCRQYEYDEYLESDDEEFLRLNGIDASRKRAFRKSHRTAKRKMTMKEKLALINEDKLDEEDDPINPFF